MYSTFNKETKKQLLSLYAVSGLANFGDYMITLGLVYHLSSKFGLDSFLIGIASSVITAGYLLFMIIGEKIYENFKPVNVVCCALVGMMITMLGMAFTNSVVVFYVLLFINGASKSMLWPQLTGLISRGKEGLLLSKAQTGFNFSWSLLAGISPFISGFILMYSTSIVFTIASGIVLVAVFFLFSSPLSRNAESDKKNITHINMLDHSTKLRYFSWVGLLLMYMLKFSISTCLPLYARDTLNLVESQTGFLMMVGGLTSSFFFYVFGRIRWWKFNGWATIVPHFVIVILLLMAQSATSFSKLIIFNLFYGIVFAFVYTQSLFNAMSGALNKSVRMMFHEVVLTVGSVIGSSLGGYFFRETDWAGMMNYFLLGTFAVVAVEVFLVYSMRRSLIAEDLAHFNDKENKKVT